jgi:hypothetical protein
MFAIALFTPLWFMWGFIFAVIEGSALWYRAIGKTKENWTLSALVWRNTGPKSKVARALFGLGWIILTTHLFWHIP